MSTVKRFFLYLISIISFGVFLGGATTLLTLIFELVFGSTFWESYAFTQLSIGLAMFLIGGTLWVVFWRIIQRASARDSVEAGSGLRKLYLDGILTVTAITALSNLSMLAGDLIIGSNGSQLAAQLSAVIVMSCVWYYHSHVENKEGQPSSVGKTLHRWYVFILASYGLVSAVVNTIGLVDSVVSYLASWGQFTVRGGTAFNVVGGSVIWILLGALTWWYFWFRIGRYDHESVLRQVYLYLLAITGGTVAALSALSTLLYNLLLLLFGSSAAPDTVSFLGWTIPTILVTGGVWLYHRKVVAEEAEKMPVDQQSPHRLYQYLISFIGLGASFTGIVYLFMMIVGLIFDVSGSYTLANDFWSSNLSLSLALLLVGIPVWLYSWRQVLKMVGDGGAVERGTVSRRIFVYAVLAGSLIAAVVTLVIIVYQTINGFLSGNFDNNTFENLTISISVCLTAIPVLFYHWKVLREDQELGAEKTVIRRKRVNILAGEPDDELVQKIEKSLGYRVRKLRFTGGTGVKASVLTEQEIETLISDVSNAEGDGVIIDLTDATVRMLPFEDK